MNAEKDSVVRKRPSYIPRSDWAAACLGFFIVWLLYHTATQRGADGFWTLLTLFFIAAAATGLVEALSRDRREKPWQFVLTCGVLATAFWFYFSGSVRNLQTLLWDLGGIVIGGILGTAVLAIFLAVVQRNKAQAAGVFRVGSSDVLPVCVILMGWFAITLLTLYRHEPLPRNPQRFADIIPANSIVAPQAARWQSVRVGLALSGGGYRAAVYHAGTLHALEKLGIRVRVLSTVSGGSIIGAYYALGGEPAAFKNAVADGRFNLKRELSLLNNVWRLPFPFTVPIVNVQLFKWYDFSRRDVQSNLLNRTLFVDEESWRQPSQDLPALVINTTDLTFGQQFGLTPDGAVVIRTDRSAEAFRGDAWRMSREFSLADRVAISGAFPLAFPAAPVAVSTRSAEPLERVNPLLESAAKEILLSDGGIFDNSGFLMLEAVNRFARQPAGPNSADARLASDIFLVSDAGAIFGVEPELSGLAQVVRAADVGSAMSGSRETAATLPRRVDFSVQEHFADTALLFRVYGATKFFEQLMPAANLDRQPRFDPSGFPPGVLTEIAALMPAGPLAQSGCSAEAIRGASCDLKALRRLVTDSMLVRLAQFRAFSTLDDLPGRERVEDIYALGQLLVYLQWPALSQELDASVEALTGAIAPGAR